MIFWTTLIVALILGWLFYPTFAFWVSPTPEYSAIDPQKAKAVKVIAHRGASGHAPENTLTAVKKALEMGADVVEIDVHLSKDGAVIVLHDETVDRTTDGVGKVHELTTEELKALDAGSWYDPLFAGERVPTLEEVLTLINGNTVCLIEIKWSEEFLYEGIVEKIHNIIAEKKAEKWCVIQSFASDYLMQSAKTNPRIPIHQLVVAKRSMPIPFQYDRKFKFGDDLPAFTAAINPFYITVDESMVKNWQAQEFIVYTYTVNEEVDMLKLINMGVDGIITNYPDRLLALKKKVD